MTKGRQDDRVYVSYENTVTSVVILDSGTVCAATAFLALIVAIPTISGHYNSR